MHPGGGQPFQELTISRAQRHRTLLLRRHANSPDRQRGRGSLPLPPSQRNRPELSSDTLLEPLLLSPGKTASRGGRPEQRCRSVVLDAIVYVVRGGIAWRQLPAAFPPATMVYAIFARWVRVGVWQRSHDLLCDRVRVRG
ncbi:transposase [Rhodococcus koreensis]